MTLEYLRHLVATKGVLHALKRVGQIANRFSRGEKRFGEMISFLESNHDFQGVKITFCVTACLLQRHQCVVNQLQQLGHDIASHGYFHTDMKRKSNAEQSAFHYLSLGGRRLETELNVSKAARKVPALLDVRSPKDLPERCTNLLIVSAQQFVRHRYSAQRSDHRSRSANV